MLSRKFKSTFLCFLAFFAISNAVNIKCTFRVEFWQGIGEEYGCFDAEVIDARNASHVTSMQGLHLPGFNSTDVHIFSLVGENSLQEIPRGIERYFPRLQAFRWEDSNLTTISEANLRYFPRLTALSVWNNKITHLEDNLFSKTKDLTYIHFSSNALTKIGHNIFEGLEGLTEAYFQNSGCVNFYAKTPNKLKKLKKMIEEKC